MDDSLRPRFAPLAMGDERESLTRYEAWLAGLTPGPRVGPVR